MRGARFLQWMDFETGFYLVRHARCGPVGRGAFLAACLMPCWARADVVLLEDGTRLEGKVLEEGPEGILLRSYDEGDVTLPPARVRRVTPRRHLIDEYESRASAATTAQAHFDLGVWCRSKRMAHWARIEFERAVELDPEHREARRELGHRWDREAQRWRTEEEWLLSRGRVRTPDGDWVAEEEYYGRAKPQGAVELRLTVAVRPDAPESFFPGLESRLREFARKLWEATDGQMYVIEFRVADRSEDSEIVITNLDSDRAKPGEYYGIVIDGHIELGGQFPVVTLLHEWGHYAFDLPEEYADFTGEGQDCNDCAMDPWDGVYAYCDATNHRGPGGCCWERILRRHPDWTHPRTGFGEAPTTHIVIENR